MGVFSLFRRKSKEEVEEVSEATAVAEDVTEEPAGAGTPEAVKAVDAAAAADPVESVDIPKQQSAEEAADNEAGEGARK